MAKTPLRALRVSDELWRAAQARARDADETVSEVVRRALTHYVGGRAVDGDHRAPSALSGDSHLLLAQGMLMQRYGLGVDEASAHLGQVAQDQGLSVEQIALRLLDGRSDHLEATSLS